MGSEGLWGLESSSLDEEEKLNELYLIGRSLSEMDDVTFGARKTIWGFPGYGWRWRILRGEVNLVLKWRGL